MAETFLAVSLAEKLSSAPIDRIVIHLPQDYSTIIDVLLEDVTNMCDTAALSLADLTHPALSLAGVTNPTLALADVTNPALSLADVTNPASVPLIGWCN